MTIRSKGPGAGFGWLKHGISIIFRHPKPILGGAGFLTLVSMIPSLITIPLQLPAMQAGMQPDPSTFYLVMAVSLAASLLIVPLHAGYLQVFNAAEHGQPARALDIFKPYRQREALRLLGYGLVMMMIYLGVFALIVTSSGSGIVHWYMQLSTARLQHQPSTISLPAGFGTAVALTCVFALFMAGAYAISLGQIALHRRSVFGAIGDGLVGAVKNVLPLLVLMLCMFCAFIVSVIVFAIIALVFGLIGALLGPIFLLVVILPIDIAIAAAMIAVISGIAYHIWRDVCGDETSTHGTAPMAA